MDLDSFDDFDGDDLTALLHAKQCLMEDFGHEEEYELETLNIGVPIQMAFGLHCVMHFHDLERKMIPQYMDKVRKDWHEIISDLQRILNHKMACNEGCQGKKG